MDVLFYFLTDTFSADDLYMLVCLRSSDRETKVEAEVISFRIVLLGHNLTRSPLISVVPYKDLWSLNKMYPYRL